MKTFIYECRDALKLSQSQFALQIGAKKSTVACWETGKRTPRYPALQNIINLVRKKGIAANFDLLFPLSSSNDETI